MEWRKPTRSTKTKRQERNRKRTRVGEQSVPADNHMAKNCTFRYDRPKKKKKVFLDFYCKRKVYHVVSKALIYQSHR